MSFTKEITPILDESEDSRYDQQDTQPTSEKTQDLSKLTLHLESQRTSQTLNLADQVIGDEGAKLVADFLKRYSHFTTIELRGNNLSSEGLASICQALKGSTTLTTILAEWNMIGSSTTNVGFEALYELAKVSRSLTTLDFRNNRISPSAGPVLAKIIRDSPALEFIDLRWNDLGNEGAKQILAAVQAQSRKLRVDLCGNRVSEEVFTSMEHPSDGVRRSLDFQTSLKQSYLNETPVGNNRRHQSVSPKKKSPSKSVSFSELKHSKYLSQFLGSGGASRDTSGYSNGKVVVNPSPARQRPTQVESIDYMNRGSVKSNYEAPTTSHPTPVKGVRTDTKLFSELKTFTDTKPSFSPATTGFGFSSKGVSPDLRLSALRPPLGRASIYQPEADLKKIQSIYEQEAKEIQQKYQTHIETHLKLTQSLQECEQLLNEERARAAELEANYNAVGRELENERLMRKKLEEKSLELGEELRQKDILCSDLGVRYEMLAQEVQNLRSDVQKYQEALRETEEQANRRIREQEAQHMNQVGQLNSQLEGMRREFERMAQAHAAQLQDVARDYETKLQREDEQLREAKKALVEQENQIKNMNDYVQKLQLAHQDEMKRFEAQAQENLGSKIQQVINAADVEINRVTGEREEALRKLEELMRETQLFEKKVNDERLSWQNEDRRVREELERLKRAVGLFDEERNQWRLEVQNRDNAIRAMERDSENYKRELGRMRDALKENQDRLTHEHNAEKRRMADYMREIEGRNKELERLLAVSEEELRRARQEYDKMKEGLQGNINKLISQAFNEHGPRASYKPGF